MEHSDEEVQVSISSDLNEAADNESWGFREFMMMYEPYPECIEFFSECNFKGKSFEICDNTPSFSAENINQVIKSIKVPVNMAVTGFMDEEYQGGKIRYTESQECIQDFQFSLEQISSIPRWVPVDTLGANLRRKRLD
jgi:hypothetical protein